MKIKTDYFCFYKHFYLCIAFSLISFYLYSQTLNSIRDKLCPGSTKTWYQAGTLARIDPGVGDKKCIFSKKDKKFKSYIFSENYAWKKQKELPWKLLRGTENPSRFVLIIGDNITAFSFKKENGKLYLRLLIPEWHSVIKLE